MSQNIFNRPKFELHDLTGITNRKEQQRKLVSAFAAYKSFLADRVSPAQQQWARQLLEGGDANEEQLAKAKYITKHPHVTLAPYDLASVRDVVFPSLSLFTYMSKERMDAHVQKNGVRVSYGAQLVDKTQHGEFPTGAYASTIKPFAEDVGTRVMGRHFFGVGNSLAAPDGSRDPIDTSHFVSFCSTTGFSAKGRLKFRQFQGHNRDFDHYVLPTPEHKVDEYIHIDIVAVGRTLIPKEAVQWDYVPRANSDIVDASGHGEDLIPIAPGAGGPRIICSRHRSI